MSLMNTGAIYSFTYKQNKKHTYIDAVIHKKNYIP